MEAYFLFHLGGTYIMHGVDTILPTADPHPDAGACCDITLVQFAPHSAPQHAGLTDYSLIACLHCVMFWLWRRAPC